MAKSSMNLQDSFLNQVRKDNVEVKLILLDGAKLVGVVRGFDSFTVILASDGTHHLIYKHAIAQIISKRFNPRRDGGRDGSRDGARPEGERSEERRPPRRQNPNARDKAPKDKEPKGEAFNTLNMSQVVVSEDSK